jgi:hypothetical protein
VKIQFYAYGKMFSINTNYMLPVEHKGIERRGDETIPLANKAGTEKQDI